MCAQYNYGHRTNKPLYGKQNNKGKSKKRELDGRLRNIVNIFKEKQYEKLSDVSILDTLEHTFQRVPNSQIRGIYQRFMKIEKVKELKDKRSRLFMLYVLIKYKESRDVLKGDAPLFLSEIIKELLRFNNQNEFNRAFKYAQNLFETIVAVAKK